MKKAVIILVGILSIIMLSGCNQATSNDEDKKALLERMNYLNSQEKEFYEVKIDIYGLNDPIFYEYSFKDLGNDKFVSTISKNGVEKIYIYGNVEEIFFNGNEIEKNILVMDEADYFRNYVTLFGRYYEFDLTGAAYYTEKKKGPQKDNGLLNHFFKYYPLDEFKISFFDQTFEFSKVLIEFSSYEKDDETTPFFNYKITGDLLNASEAILIEINQIIK